MRLGSFEKNKSIMNNIHDSLLSFRTMGQAHSVKPSTHVANACDEAIYAAVTGDRVYLIQSEKEINTSLSVAKANGANVGISQGENLKATYHWDYAQHHGFTKISAHDFLRFQPDVDRDELFVSIITASVHWVASCFPIPVDKSVIVDKKKNLRRTRFGDIWIDEQGRKHG